MNDLFHPLVQRWFTERFHQPTPAQAAGWQSIAAGQSTLIAAPTGSGKTLAAFLWSIDRLIKRALGGALDERTSVVYVSPLKALGNDIAKNLQAPLAEIYDLAGTRRDSCCRRFALRCALAIRRRTSARRWCAGRRIFSSPRRSRFIFCSRRRAAGDFCKPPRR